MQLDIKQFQKDQSRQMVDDIKDVSHDVKAINDQPIHNDAAVASHKLASHAIVLNDTANVREGDILPPAKQEIAPVTAPAALRGIDLSQITSKAALICALTFNLPRNDYKMPKILYQPDKLDPSIFLLIPATSTSTSTSTPTPQPYSSPDTPTATTVSVGRSGAPDVSGFDKFKLMQEMLDASAIRVDYHEGFPSIKDRPLWERFDWETVEDFEAFKNYLELPGARQISMLPPNYRAGAGDLFHCNYWAIRCLASDQFAAAHYQRQRERRILETDDAHFLKAEMLLDKLYKLIPELNFDTLKDDPKQYVEVMEKLAKLQRAALGVSEKRSEEQSTPKSVEVIMRRQTEQLSLGDQQTAEETGIDITKILSDPDGARSAQELILRVNS